MKIKLINHACALIESDNVRIITDPWLKGRIFDNGWSLVDTSYKLDYNSFDYVWLSHEHPDHFSPKSFCENEISNKKKIIIQDRKNDKKLEKFFSAKKYDILKIPQKGQLKLSNKVRLLGGISKSFDSWVAITNGDKTVLNLNDCIDFSDISQIRKIKATVGHIDVLMIQFSFANWTGNPGDKNTPERAKKMMFESLTNIFNVLKVIVCSFSGINGISYIKFS